MNNTKAAYGGVQRINAMAPQAPGPTHQGQVVSGQSSLNDQLANQSKQTMRLPSTPVKGLLQRVAPQGMAGQSPRGIAGRPQMPAGLGRDIGYV